MNVLFLNWRDADHDRAGGAEKYISSLSDYLIAEGHHATIFSKGNAFTVYFNAFRFILRHKREFDVIIDCDNGISFFTPFYARNARIFCLFHHVHKDIFKKYIIWPFSYVAIFIEKYIVTRIYKNYIAVSSSTKAGLEKLGVPPAKISIAHAGVEKEFIPGKKNTVPTICYIGRLKKYKGIETLLQAWKIVLAAAPKAKLIIAGKGDDEVRLKEITKKLELSDSVLFTGFITDAEKIELFQTSWLSVLPSEVEGWGMTIIESNACATPAIGSNVAGLQDSIKDGYSGFLFTHGKHKELAEKIISYVQKTAKERKLFETQAKEWAAQFSIEKSGKEFLDIIEE